MIIGRQIRTDHGGIIDLLAIDDAGSLILIELKKDLTPREVVAQSLDYAAWVEGLSPDQVTEIFNAYTSSYRPELKQKTLDQVFTERFGLVLDDLEISQSHHQIVIVASRLDPSTERIVKYLAWRGIEINVVFFKVFADEDRRFLSRVWFIDRTEVGEQGAISQRTVKGEWNGDSYVSFGVDERRSWEDAVKYGFISAGGGRWYSNTLSLLSPGDRIFVNVPRRGYVGVGTVEEPSKKVDEFFVAQPDGSKARILDLPLHSQLGKDKDDPDLAEYLVRVRWVKTVTLERAIREVGFFGNQNSACRRSRQSGTALWKRVTQLFDLSCCT